MTTFSQLVDALVSETRRPDLRAEIATYVNQTIREVHFEPQRGHAVMYRDNFNETLLTSNVESGFSWEIPDPAMFQAMQVVCYGGRIYPPEVTPSRALAELTEYYYRAGGQYVFSGYCGLNQRIALGYYAFPRRLVYYESNRRPAEYSPDFAWTYYGTFGDSEPLRVAAQSYVSNWLLIRWVDVISEGVRAKIYKRISDTERARTCYSLYMSLRQGLYTSEVADLGGFV